MASWQRTQNRDHGSARNRFTAIASSHRRHCPYVPSSISRSACLTRSSTPDAIFRSVTTRSRSAMFRAWSIVSPRGSASSASRPARNCRSNSICFLRSARRNSSLCSAFILMEVSFLLWKIHRTRDSPSPSIPLSPDLPLEIT